MQGIAAVAIAVLIVGSFTVGLRLLLLHRRTGAAPELLLGGMLLLAVGVGYAMMIATPRVAPESRPMLQMLSTFATCSGFSLLFAFTWRVFHPQAWWARVFAGAGMLTMVVAVVRRIVQVQTRGVLDITQEAAVDLALQGGTVVVAYSWTAWESLRYWGMMRRRVGLGLADPTVCNRFLLWGLMALTVNAGIAVNIVAFAIHVDSLQTPWVLLLSSTTGLTQVVLLVLAFLPPRSYLSWVRARASAGRA